eukprot:CAMPEP_0114137456 /NCGR_PEP_ID=MMETSP0043_2-20121206/15785_1 /TAXON_ID=464988 /ORGANISM="Hemiselmis andersenii, Strain CCMP644" /LENGTH=223 /DNA_ID=CAMNT_0001231333 /DNA_START=180 /DNA_END=851 /DNA_ORIENTATION=+
MATSTPKTSELPKHRGHRGEILGLALYKMGGSMASALSPTTAASHANAELASPKHENFRHHHGSVRGGAISAVLRQGSMPMLMKHFNAPNMVRSLTDLRTAHMDGRKLSHLREGGEAHSGYLKFHDRKQWKQQWCVVGEDSTLYVCPEQGEESVCALPLGGGVVSDVSEKEMAHPLTLEIEFLRVDSGGKEGHETLVLRANNINDKRAWVRALQHAAGPCHSG